MAIINIALDDGTLSPKELELLSKCQGLENNGTVSDDEVLRIGG